MTNVYIVCKGEFAEGHDPIGIRSTYAGAVNLAAVHAKAGTRIERVADGRWKAANGCDEVWIYRMEVDQ